MSEGQFTRQITLCRCNKPDRLKNLEGLELGATVHLVRQEAPSDGNDGPIVVLTDSGLDIGEVPTPEARSITGNKHIGSVIGFEQKSKWKAPIVSFRQTYTRPYISSASFTHTVNLFEPGAKLEITSVNFPVRGSQIDDRMERTRQLRVGDWVELVREPDNPKDPNAILVTLLNGGEIGYVPRDVAEKIAPLIDSGKRATASVSKILDRRFVPIVDVRLSSLRSADRHPIPSPITYRELPRQTGPSAGQVAAVIILVVVGLIVGLIKIL